MSGDAITIRELYEFLQRHGDVDAPAFEAVDATDEHSVVSQFD